MLAPISAVSLLSLLALSLVFASVPTAWAAGEECSTDGDCGSDETCRDHAGSRICMVRGGLGSTCDATTVCGEFLTCVEGFCTFDDTNNNGTDVQVIPADGACELFNFERQCIKDYFCNPLSNTCESAVIQSCTVTTIGTSGSGCKPTQWCTPLDEANSASGAPGACITITADPNNNVCTPACPTGQTCALGICINDNVGNQCSPACATGQICVANVCVADTGAQCSATVQCPTGKTCVAGICVTDIDSCPAEGCATGSTCVAGVCVPSSCPTEGCGTGKTCVAGVCVADNTSSCPTEGCGEGKSCVDGVCVADAPTCPTEGCGTGKTCIAGVCVADSNTCPTEGCGAGKSCVAGVCVADAVVPTTCSAEKPCTNGQTCVSGVCTPGTGAQNQCSPACTTGNTCINSVCVADGSAFTGTLGSRCDAAHGCNTNLACFANFCVPSNLAAQAGGASAVHATVSVLASLAIACVAALMTV